MVSVQISCPATESFRANTRVAAGGGLTCVVAAEGTWWSTEAELWFRFLGQILWATATWAMDSRPVQVPVFLGLDRKKILVLYMYI